MLSLFPCKCSSTEAINKHHCGGQTDEERAVDIDAKAIQLADVSANASVEKSGEGELTFKGTPLLGNQR